MKHEKQVTIEDAPGDRAAGYMTESDVSEMARYLLRGWPKCVGETQSIDSWIKGHLRPFPKETP